MTGPLPLAELTSLAAGTHWRILLVSLLMIPGRRPCAMRRWKAASSSVDAAVMPTLYGHMDMDMHMRTWTWTWTCWHPLT